MIASRADDTRSRRRDKAIQRSKKPFRTGSDLLRLVHLLLELGYFGAGTVHVLERHTNVAVGARRPRDAVSSVRLCAGLQGRCGARKHSDECSSHASCARLGLQLSEVDGARRGCSSLRLWCNRAGGSHGCKGRQQRVEYFSMSQRNHSAGTLQHVSCKKPWRLSLACKTRASVA